MEPRGTTSGHGESARWPGTPSRARSGRGRQAGATWGIQASRRVEAGPLWAEHQAEAWPHQAERRAEAGRGQPNASRGIWAEAGCGHAGSLRELQARVARAH
ncbi:hypothetical protein GUJ93_ZPchr0001g32561 [Zizania palustris]|uniref:Uncharacterized protein n=1 Tax=Zizania palustris TaxID=103762 RepID=A0A8J5VQA1_ZIZPA|nr:hypothetical protein GUJ93_ZPchr0001g32561 [Zizania palustris]